MTNQVLSDVKSVGGVVGCFLYDQKNGVVAADAPALFKPAKLQEVGRALAKTLKAGNLALPEGSDVSLYYEEILIVAREIRKNTLLVVLCDPSMNVNLLSMSLNLAMEELQELAAHSDAAAPGPAPVERAATPQKAAPQQPPKVPAPSRAPQPKANAAEIGEDAKKALEAMLAKVVGPMASIIFKDSLDAWQAKGGGPVSGLVAEICREIGDVGKAGRFEILASHALANVEGAHG